VLPSLDGRLLAFAVRFLPVGWITRAVEQCARPKKSAGKEIS
jgi:hypothetical protein